MEYQRVEKVFYAKMRHISGSEIAYALSMPYHSVANRMGCADSAAAVFEEAARLSYQLRQLWPQASALTPKAPAQASVSPKAAQTHRLSNGQCNSSKMKCKVFIYCCQ
jgi:hypothetical protein